MNAASIPPDVLLVVAALAVTIVLVQALTALLRRWARRRRMSLRMIRAVRGEARAPSMLEDRGFAVIGAQVVVDHAVRIDDRVVVVPLRADYIAERAGERFVVEVKTGALAPRIETSATRRQILEYRIAFDVDGVVLVDADAGRVHEITFPELARFGRASSPPGPWGVAAVALAALAAAAVAVAVIIAHVA
ncbi:MAG: hypothetical protein NVS3B10_29700 [Polyangiales bacterium]